MEYLFIYCLQLFDSIDFLKITSWMVLLFGGGFYMIGKCMYLSDEKLYDDIKNVYEKILDKLIVYVLLICLITSFVPTKQTLLLMGGMYLGKKAVNTVITDDKIKKVDTIINLELDKRIKELKGE